MRWLIIKWLAAYGLVGLTVFISTFQAGMGIENGLRFGAIFTPVVTLGVWLDVMNRRAARSRSTIDGPPRHPMERYEVPKRYSRFKARKPTRRIP